MHVLLYLFQFTLYLSFSIAMCSEQKSITYTAPNLIFITHPVISSFLKQIEDPEVRVLFYAALATEHALANVIFLRTKIHLDENSKKLFLKSMQALISDFKQDILQDILVQYNCPEKDSTSHHTPLIALINDAETLAYILSSNPDVAAQLNKKDLLTAVIRNNYYDTRLPELIRVCIKHGAYLFSPQKNIWTLLNIRDVTLLKKVIPLLSKEQLQECDSRGFSVTKLLSHFIQEIANEKEQIDLWQLLIKQGLCLFQVNAENRPYILNLYILKALLKDIAPQELQQTQSHNTSLLTDVISFYFLDQLDDFQLLSDIVQEFSKKGVGLLYHQHDTSKEFLFENTAFAQIKDPHIATLLLPLIPEEDFKRVDSSGRSFAQFILAQSMNMYGKHYSDPQVVELVMQVVGRYNNILEYIDNPPEEICANIPLLKKLIPLLSADLLQKQYTHCNFIESIFRFIQVHGRDFLESDIVEIICAINKKDLLSFEVNKIGDIPYILFIYDTPFIQKVIKSLTAEDILALNNKMVRDGVPFVQELVNKIPNTEQGAKLLCLWYNKGLNFQQKTIAQDVVKKFGITFSKAPRIRKRTRRKTKSKKNTLLQGSSQNSTSCSHALTLSSDQSSVQSSSSNIIHKMTTQNEDSTLSRLYHDFMTCLQKIDAENQKRNIPTNLVETFQLCRHLHPILFYMQQLLDPKFPSSNETIRNLSIHVIEEIARSAPESFFESTSEMIRPPISIIWIPTLLEKICSTMDPQIVAKRLYPNLLKDIFMYIHDPRPSNPLSRTVSNDDKLQFIKLCTEKGIPLYAPKQDINVLEYIDDAELFQKAVHFVAPEQWREKAALSGYPAIQFLLSHIVKITQHNIDLRINLFQTIVQCGVDIFEANPQDNSPYITDVILIQKLLPYISKSSFKKTYNNKTCLLTYLIQCYFENNIQNPQLLYDIVEKVGGASLLYQSHPSSFSFDNTPFSYISDIKIAKLLLPLVPQNIFTKKDAHGTTWAHWILKNSQKLYNKLATDPEVVDFVIQQAKTGLLNENSSKPLSNIIYTNIPLMKALIPVCSPKDFQRSYVQGTLLHYVGYALSQQKPEDIKDSLALIDTIRKKGVDITDMFYNKKEINHLHYVQYAHTPFAKVLINTLTDQEIAKLNNKKLSNGNYFAHELAQNTKNIQTLKAWQEKGLQFSVVNDLGVPAHDLLNQTVRDSLYAPQEPQPRERRARKNSFSNTKLSSATLQETVLISQEKADSSSVPNANQSTLNAIQESESKSSVRSHKTQQKNTILPSIGYGTLHYQNRVIEQFLHPNPNNKDNDQYHTRCWILDLIAQNALSILLKNTTVSIAPFVTISTGQAEIYQIESQHKKQSIFHRGVLIKTHAKYQLLSEEDKQKLEKDTILLRRFRRTLNHQNNNSKLFTINLNIKNDETDAKPFSFSRIVELYPTHNIIKFNDGHNDILMILPDQLVPKIRDLFID